MGYGPLSSTTQAQVERAMSQAGLTHESKRQEFLMWYANTYNETERGLNSTNDIKQLVFQWMNTFGK